MSTLINIVVFVIGIVLVGATILSAVRTVVLPHGQSARITRGLFGAVRKLLSVHERLPVQQRRQHEIRSLYAPVALAILPLVWLTIALGGFTAMFWALETRPLRQAFKLAGSSMLTIGFFDVDDIPRLSVSFFAAALTISLLALLLVTYLPSMYQAYSARETAITALETFAGEPPDPAELLIRYHRIGAIDQLPDLWEEWQQLFFTLRESHTALPAVVLFRSSSPQRHWVQAVEALLDGAALWNSCCRTEQDPQASLCLRAGSLALTEIAAFFRIETRREHDSGEAISVDRAVFDRYYEALLGADVALSTTKDEAWTKWHGWRVNYDEALVGLAEVTGSPTSHR